MSTTPRPAATKQKSRKKTVLVTGAAGALAQQVINRLRGKYQIVAVDFRELTYLRDDIPSYKIDFNKRVFEDLFKTYSFLSYRASVWNRANVVVIWCRLCLNMYFYKSYRQFLWSVFAMGPNLV